MIEFRQFVLDEMKKHRESNREFARRVGVSHQTINRVLDDRYDAGPSADTLLKISQATGISAVTLFEMAYPEARQAGALSTDSRALAQRIERLSPELKAAILAIIRGAQA